jgi:hypothetical protein
MSPEATNEGNTIRVRIDGLWTADEMASFLGVCDELYNLGISKGITTDGR